MNAYGRLTAITLGVAALASSSARARSEGAESHELADALLHSELPLFGDTYVDKSPQHFMDAATNDFGCTSRVSFGDWMYKPVDPEREPSWYRFHNYGVFHCWAIASAADERADLEHGEFRPSFFVKVGEARVRGASTELWALQMGARPGSDYLLLSCPASKKEVDALRSCNARVRSRGVSRATGSTFCGRTIA